MSNNEISIGVASTSGSWIKIPDLDTTHWIAENSQSYSITDGYLNMRLLIAKGTTEGKYLADLIKDVAVDKCNVEHVDAYLKEISLKRISPFKLTALIDEAISDAFDKGRDAKSREICHALGVVGQY